jgi:hypothetical protein
MGKLLNDDFINNLPKLQRVRVIAARCETSSYEIYVNALFWKERKTI